MTIHTIRAVASLPEPERQKIIAAIADPEIPSTFDAPAPPGGGARVDYNQDRLRKLVQMQLEGFSPPIMVSARRLPVQTDRSVDRDQSWSASEQEAVVEAALPDGQRMSITLPGLPAAPYGGYSIAQYF